MYLYRYLEMDLSALTWIWFHLACQDNDYDDKNHFYTHYELSCSALTWLWFDLASHDNNYEDKVANHFGVGCGSRSWDTCVSCLTSKKLVYLVF